MKNQSNKYQQQLKRKIQIVAEKPEQTVSKNTIKRKIQVVDEKLEQPVAKEPRAYKKKQAHRMSNNSLKKIYIL